MKTRKDLYRQNIGNVTQRRKRGIQGVYKSFKIAPLIPTPGFRITVVVTHGYQWEHSAFLNLGGVKKIHEPLNKSTKSLSLNRQ